MRAVPVVVVQPVCRMSELIPSIDAPADEIWRTLTELLHERIHDGLAGLVSPKSVGEILDNELA